MGTTDRSSSSSPTCRRACRWRGDEIPAGADQSARDAQRPGLSPAQSLTSIFGVNAEGATPLRRAVETPSSIVTKHQPWLADEVAHGRHDAEPCGARVGFVHAPTRGCSLGTGLPVKLASSGRAAPSAACGSSC